MKFHSTKHTLIAIFTLMLTAHSLALSLNRTSAETRSPRMHTTDPQTPLGLQKFFRHSEGRLSIVSAHRGGPRKGFPENCIPTFENTLQHTFSIMEIDPRYTKDGAIVLHHDARLERTTTGQGLVSEMSLRELKQLRLKDSEGSITEFHIPTLDEVLEWARGKTILILDQKDVPVEARVKKIEEHKAEAYAMLIVYSYKDARTCYSMNPDIMMEVMIPSRAKLIEFEKTGVPWRNIIAFVGHSPPQDLTLYELINAKGTSCVVGSSRNLDRQYVGTEVAGMGALEQDYRALLQRGADFIETDLPREVGRLLYGVQGKDEPTGMRAIQKVLEQDYAAKSKDGLSDSIVWLEQEAHRIIRDSKRTMKDGSAFFPPQVGIGYEAFWLRDYAYTLEGSINAYSDKELTDACRLFVKSIRADGAGVDCIKADGTPIYKPGYGSMGKNPVADGSQFTIAVAWRTFQKTKDIALLQEIIDLLVKTMDVVPRNPENGLVHIQEGNEWDRCPYGFTDTVRKQGDVLFSSLLYIQACRRLSDLLTVVERTKEAKKWKEEGRRVTSSVREVFWDSEAGLFRAATVRCREHDIWGSAFAVYLKVADADQSSAVATTFKNNYSRIVQSGQIRHLPGGQYWEQGCARDTYQNGAYWATPTGWFVYALDIVDPELADQTIIDMVSDFQKHGACEWIIGTQRQLLHYLASASLPLDGIRAMLRHRAEVFGKKKMSIP